MEELPPDAPAPRLCHLVKWPDFEGYGFNLHAEKSRSGQFIGKVDAGSPAETAGLKEGDRIVEVNGVNIAQENHRQVVERIKAHPQETRLLVLDVPADQWYRERKLVVRGTHANVLHLKTPTPRPTQQENGASHEQHEQVDGNRQSNGSVVAEKEEDSNIRPSKVNDEDEEVPPPPTPPEESPDSPRSTRSNQSGGSSNHNGHAHHHTDGDGVLNLNMSASEMRQMLANRRRKDPKKEPMDIRQKYEIIQQM